MITIKQLPGALKLLRAVLAFLFLLAAYALGPARAASLTIDGAVNPPISSYSSSTLAGLTHEAITYDTYTGISLWSLLRGSSNGIVPHTVEGGATNNPLLRSFVTATGGNGSRSLFSIGEIDPRFGGFDGDPVIVAYKKGDTLLDTPRLIEREDPNGARDVAELVSLHVASLPQLAAKARTPSIEFDVFGAVGTAGSFTLNSLKQLVNSPTPPFSETTLINISFNNGPGFDYTGVRLWDLLNYAGIDTNVTLQGYVLARATDDYQIVFSLAELDPDRRGPQDVLVAYERSEGGLGDNGFARLVVPGDQAGGRYLSNLASLEVVYIQAVPEAHTWALMLAGLALVGLSVRRRLIARA